MKMLRRSFSDLNESPQYVYLSLGSNLGDRESSIYRAVEEIARHIGPVQSSSLYETTPLYIREQPLFLNAACKAVSNLSPHELLATTKRIESDLGRIRKSGSRNSPRVIDIDILLYGEWRISERHLTIPHPGILERKFVLVPLLELDPDLRDPVTGTRYADVLSSVGEQGIYYFSANRYHLHDHGG